MADDNRANLPERFPLHDLEDATSCRPVSRSERAHLFVVNAFCVCCVLGQSDAFTTAEGSETKPKWVCFLLSLFFFSQTLAALDSRVDALGIPRAVCVLDHALRRARQPYV